MEVVNLLSCEPDETFGRGAFQARLYDLTDRLGASVLGATVWDVEAGRKSGPYHFHYGVEEWLYVVSGTPILRDPEAERSLQPGDLVAFPSGPAGAHMLHGLGRVVIFSAGARGWGEAFVTAYPDSDKLGAAPGVMFRRADAIDSWLEEAPEPPDSVVRDGSTDRLLNLLTAELEPAGADSSAREGARELVLGPRLSAQTWAATLYELSPGEAATPYHYKWCREEWALVLSGAPMLRHADGRTGLTAGDICCFPQGPTGAHQLRNDDAAAARLIVFSTATNRPMSAFYPDDETVLVQISDGERLVFRHEDRIEDYWDGEPGAV